LSLGSQAATLDAQIRLGFNAGCAGLVIDSWKDDTTNVAWWIRWAVLNRL